MASRDPARSIPAWSLAFDVVIAAPITIVWLGLFELRSTVTAALLHTLAFVLRIIGVLMYRHRALRGLAELVEPSELAVDRLRRFPLEHALVHALSWMGYFALGLAISASVSALIATPDDLVVGTLIVLGISIGTFVPNLFAAQAEVEPLCLSLASPIDAPPPLTTRFVTHSISLVVAAVLIVGAVAWRCGVALDGPGLWRNLTLSLLAILVFVGFSATAAARSFLAPVERVRSTIARLADVGDITAIPALPVARADELGELTRDLNRLLDGLQRLTSAARSLTLDQPIDGPQPRGELADVMRSFVERMRTVITQTHGAIEKLNITAAALRTTAQTQELVHEQQLDSVNSIGKTMNSLERSAAQIAAAVVEVSDNAESTLAATDELAESIARLDSHTQGIRDLLEIIREVASRSDLLALNGALEAMRVGDEGRGFALVADEMRRLAERVTGTVGDVRRLVGDISEGSEASVDLTELGRTLAEGTTNAAREIASATYRQTTETEQVARAVRELAEFIRQTTDATEQTRRLAEELQGQAMVLEGGVRGLEGHGNMQA